MPLRQRPYSWPTGDGAKRSPDPEFSDGFTIEEWGKARPRRLSVFGKSVAILIPFACLFIFSPARTEKTNPSIAKPATTLGLVQDTSTEAERIVPIDGSISNTLLREFPELELNKRQNTWIRLIRETIELNRDVIINPDADDLKNPSANMVLLGTSLRMPSVDGLERIDLSHIASVGKDVDPAVAAAEMETETTEPAFANTEPGDEMIASEEEGRHEPDSTGQTTAVIHEEAVSHNEQLGSVQAVVETEADLDAFEPVVTEPSLAAQSIEQFQIEPEPVEPEPMQAALFVDPGMVGSGSGEGEDVQVEVDEDGRQDGKLADPVEKRNSATSVDQPEGLTDEANIQETAPPAVVVDQADSPSIQSVPVTGEPDTGPKQEAKSGNTLLMGYLLAALAAFVAFFAFVVRLFKRDEEFRAQIKAVSDILITVCTLGLVFRMPLAETEDYGAQGEKLISRPAVRSTADKVKTLGRKIVQDRSLTPQKKRLLFLGLLELAEARKEEDPNNLTWFTVSEYLTSKVEEYGQTPASDDDKKDDRLNITG